MVFFGTRFQTILEPALVVGKCIVLLIAAVSLAEWAVIRSDRACDIKACDDAILHGVDSDRLDDVDDSIWPDSCVPLNATAMSSAEWSDR